MRWQTLYEARWIFLVAILATVILTMVLPWAGILGILAILYVFYFFRDPSRRIPQEPDAVVAAADGVVVEIKELVETEVLKAPAKRVAIFLSVFDVHVNRSPIAGKVIFSERTKGEFLDARNPEATNRNERRTWGIQGEKATLVVRQITGAIATRIVAWSKVGDQIDKGHRFGMIRFGSRTEVYLPLDSEITVKVGQRVRGGASVIARLSSSHG